MYRLQLILFCGTGGKCFPKNLQYACESFSANTIWHKKQPQMDYFQVSYKNRSISLQIMQAVEVALTMTPKAMLISSLFCCFRLSDPFFFFLFFLHRSYFQITEPKPAYLHHSSFLRLSAKPWSLAGRCSPPLVATWRPLDGLEVQWWDADFHFKLSTLSSLFWSKNVGVGGYNLQSRVQVQTGLWFLEAENYSKGFCVAAPKAVLQVHSD